MHVRNYYSSPKNTKKKAVLTIFYQINRTPLSLFSSYPKFGIALKFLKQEKSLNYDKARRKEQNAVEWVYES